MATGPAAQTPAAEPVDLIATLDAVCVSAGGDAARAAELAAEAGFSPVPDSIAWPSQRLGHGRLHEIQSLGHRFVMRAGCPPDRTRAGLDGLRGVSARSTEHRALDQRLGRPWDSRRQRGGLDAYACCDRRGPCPTRDLRDPTFIAMAEIGQMRMVEAATLGPRLDHDLFPSPPRLTGRARPFS